MEDYASNHQQQPQNTLRVSVLRKITLRVLRVSPKAIARAFKSLYSLLSLNTEAGENGDAERFGKILEKGATALCVLTV